MCEEFHGPFEDQVACARYRAERDALAQRMEEVASEIDRTLLGVEGIEDAPAMRWARGLREALGALHSPRTSYEDIEAARWVREHGGLDEVKRHYFAVCALSGDLAEWKREVYELCERIGVSHEDCAGEAEMLREAYKVLDKRLMPEGMEWPRFEDSEPVRPGDRLLDKDGDWFKAVSFVFTLDWWSIRGYQTEGFGDLNDKTRRSLEGMAYGTRVKRPTPKDSWERLEEDAKKGACDYFWRGEDAPCKGCPCEHSDDCEVDKSRDLVRRAKALTERGK